jgi:hypothetical protein
VPTPVLVTQADLEARYTPRVVRQIFSDDGTQNAGPRLAIACETASAQAVALLLKAWSEEQIVTLAFEDPAVKHAICGLAMAIGAAAKPEWSGEGRPYAGLEKQSISWLKELAAAHIRSRGEAQGAGTNPTIAGRTNKPTPQYIFAETKGKRPGGY